MAKKGEGEICSEIPKTLYTLIVAIKSIKEI